MKISPQFSGFFRRRGIALILVISVLSLLVILMLAMFSATDNEFKSTQGFVASQDSRRLGDIAVNIVIDQLQHAAQPTPGSNARTIHATQPGAARVYNLDGSFNSLYKLYSSHQMQLTAATGGEAALLTDTPPGNWDTLPMRYVDLNAPVIRAFQQGATTQSLIYFPVVDPTAYRYVGTNNGAPSPADGSDTSDPYSVEGFSYDQTVKIPTAGSTIDGVVLPPTSPSTVPNVTQRLPMPVEWLYVLQDGSLGALDSGNKFIATSGATSPSATNPIVGRIAFWADDESCKININTASEPTFWATPRFYHEREHAFAEKPPTAQEFQRFPGHPATVALSSVLFPDYPGNNKFDLFALGNYNPTAVAGRVEMMQRIYDIVPKIARGGSMSGTRVFATDSESGTQVAAAQVNVNSGTVNGVAGTNSVSERLYASLDELLFSPQMSGGFRVLNDNWVPPNAGVSATPIIPVAYGRGNLLQTIESSRFFLTANSRAPEFSMLGVPRICMWPISSTNSSAYRTAYDQLIAFCATLKAGTGATSSNTYYFQRANAHSSTTDVQLTRNAKLLQYLLALSNTTMPSTSNAVTPGTSASLFAKYGTDNMHNILVEIFDYIRSTNLYDDLLASTQSQPTTTNLSQAQIDLANPATFYTYTNPLAVNIRTTDTSSNPLSAAHQLPVASGGWPGCGAVTPSKWTDGSGVYRGIGRFFTISEIGIHLICTADGLNDANSYNQVYNSDGITKYTPAGGGPSGSGGKTAPRYPTTAAAGTKNFIQQSALSAYPYLAKVSPAVTQTTAVWYSNYAPYPNTDNLNTTGALPGALQYGCTFGTFGKTTAANSPALPNNHPGFDPSNWNMTLRNNSPLRQDQKRLEACLDFELYCPAEGWTLINPDWTIVVKAGFLNNVLAQNLNSSNNLTSTAVWTNTGDLVMKANTNAFNANNVWPNGGSADPAAVFSGRRCSGAAPMPADPSFQLDPGNNPTIDLSNCSLVSAPFTVPRAGNITFTFPNQNMVVLIYDTHDYLHANPVQTINFNFAVAAGGSNTVTMPVPELVTLSTEKQSENPTTGAPLNRNQVQAPHWWAFQYAGALGRYWTTSCPPLAAATLGTAGNAGTYAVTIPDTTMATNVGVATYVTAGRFRNNLGNNAATIVSPAGVGATVLNSTTPATLPGDNAIIFALPTNTTITGKETTYGTDTIRTIIPALGDYRIIMARDTVPATMWKAHRLWSGNLTYSDGSSAICYQAHNFTGHAGDDAGFDFNIPPTPNGATTQTTPSYPQFMRAVTYPPGGSSGNPTATLAIPNFGSLMPDIPQDNGDGQGSGAALDAVNSFGDFDNGEGSTRDGAYTNKPDEGNFADLWQVYGSGVGEKQYRTGYFNADWIFDADRLGSNTYFTPNRIVSSPVMFGSLPTCIFNPTSKSLIPYPDAVLANNGVGYPSTGCGRPWQTLLFRPHVSPVDTQGNTVTGSLSTPITHPGAQNPPDHYLLDLFNMPVVQPYAISEPLSQAGKINLNYQIVPFTYIHRATAVYAAMKGELMRIIPSTPVLNTSLSQTPQDSYNEYKSTAGLPTGQVFPPLVYWTDSTPISGAAPPLSSSLPVQDYNHYWHRTIDPVETLKQLEERFAMNTGLPTNRRGLLRSASQLCELHMIPSSRDPGKPYSTAVPTGMLTVPVIGGSGSSYNPTTPTNVTTRETKMQTFWAGNSLTGDNTREEIYSHLYPKFTTRSNTFRVHVRTQAIKKARSTDPTVFDSTKDQVLSEYRGSYLLERYIDPNDSSNTLPDYTTGSSPLSQPSLDSYYRFHVLEAKRFSP